MNALTRRISAAAVLVAAPALIALGTASTGHADTAGATNNGPSFHSPTPHQAFTHRHVRHALHNRGDPERPGGEYGAGLAGDHLDRLGQRDCHRLRDDGAQPHRLRHGAGERRRDPEPCGHRRDRHHDRERVRRLDV